MILRNRFLIIVSVVLFLVPIAAYADTARGTVQDTGVSGLWMLANISFAGMRAQNHQSILWRTLAFLFGFPGTVISFFAVGEGSERAYGIDLPGRKPYAAN